jgi:hypothetical protein
MSLRVRIGSVRESASIRRASECVCMCVQTLRVALTAYTAGRTVAALRSLSKWQRRGSQGAAGEGRRRAGER